MSTRRPRLLAALCGILGIAALGYYYSVPFPLPPPNATPEQLAQFATRYHDAILFDAWLQGVGALLTVAFFIALVALAGAATRFAGLMTLVASTLTVAVSLMDVIFVIAAVQSTANGHAATGVTAFDLTSVFVYVFPMVPAPVLFLSIGSLLLGSRVLPRAFAYLALALGVVFAVLGFVGLFNAALLAVTIFVLIGQELWVAAAAITLAVYTGKASV